MANGGGRLGAVEGSTGWQSLYAPAAGVIATVDVNVANRKASTRTIQIGVVQSTSTFTPGDGETSLPTRTINAAGDSDGKDQLSMGPFVLNGTAKDTIVVQASGDDVDFQAFGVTETST